MLNSFFIFNMRYGITELSIVPLRVENKEQSEQVSQILFGETFEILEEKGVWYKVLTSLDNYEGWIDIKLATEISESTFSLINQSPKHITKDIVTILFKNKETAPILIPAGSTIPSYNYETKSFFIGENIYKVNTNISETSSNELRKNIINSAIQFLNSPYLWGGKTNFGIDCSGFSQVVLKINGINIPRDASQQVNIGNTVNIIHDVKPGDLAFFDNDDGNIIHVGIFIDENRIIHASGKVRIDKIDHQGVYNQDIGKYTHTLRVIQNIID